MFQPPVHSPAHLSDILGSLVGMLPGRREPAAIRLRKMLSERYDATDVALFASGTQALEQAIRVAVGASGHPDPLVAIPAYTCFDVGTAAIGADVRFTFFDIDPETLSPREGEILRVLDEGARVIVVSPLFGYPIDWDAVAGPVRAAGALVVEDASQGAGGTWRGKPVGALGEIGVLSFGRGKGWTGGGGGALLLRPPEGTPLTFRLPAGGSSAAGPRRAALSLIQWALGRPGLYGIPTRLPGVRLGETHYHPPITPAPMPGFCSALAYRTATLAEEAAQPRREIARRFAVEAAAIEGVRTIRVPVGSNPGFLRFPVLADRAHSGEVLDGRFRRLGMSGGYPLPLTAVPEIAAYGFEGESHFEGAQTLARTLVTLPTHRFIGEPEIDSLARALPELASP